MLDFAERVERGQQADRHESIHTQHLKNAYVSALAFLEQTLPIHKPYDVIRVAELGPSFTVTKEKIVSIPHHQGTLHIQLGKERHYQLFYKNPLILINLTYDSPIEPQTQRLERYILGDDGNLSFTDNHDPLEDKEIPSEEFAKRVQLVQEAIDAFVHPK